MSKKIIFLDMDGTLLTSDKIITERTVALLQQMLTEGHYVAFNSGRPINSIINLVKKFNVLGDNVYILGFQGNIIYEMKTGKVLDMQSIPKEKSVEVIKRLREQDIYVHSYKSDTIIAFEDKKDSDELRRYQQLTNEPAMFVKDVDEFISYDLPKIIAIDYENIDRLNAFQKENAYLEGEELESFFSQPHFLEYVKKGSNKGYGVKFLADYLNIDIADTIAVGDEQNDISMIVEAGVGVAMSNARDDVKEVADYVTENDNNHDGVAEVIQKYILI